MSRTLGERPMVSSDDNMNQRLEAYLDGQLAGKERKQFEQSAKAHPELSEQIELQKKIDESLQRMFAPPDSPRLDLPSLSSLQENEKPQVALPAEQTNHKDLAEISTGRRISRGWKIAALATAAALAWLYVGVSFLNPPSGRQQIAFNERPLTEIYRECVDQGFKPYWDCDDEVTFANTFEKRQGVKLKLAEMPSTQRMVGLSYLVGLSPNSTSMLAMVDDQPVIVFIDRVENDWGPPTGEFPEEGLSVRRTVKNGLVMYEVSPSPDTDVVGSVVLSL